MELINLFKRLASIESLSGSEQQISDFVCEYLRALNLKPIQDANNMIYCKIGDGKPKALFAAHMDTVGPTAGIQVVEDSDYIRSDGSTVLGADNKASVAAILQSVKDLVGKKSTISIELLFSVREETDSGIQEIDRSLLQSDVGFVFDGGNGVLNWVAQSAPTIQDFVVEIEGAGAHASRPEQGKNVLQVLMNLKDLIVLGRPDESTTFNIGLISGGNATNTVPSNLILKGDLRSSNRSSFSHFKNLYDATIKSQAKELDCRAKIRWIPYAYGYEIDTSGKNFMKLSEIYDSFNLSLQPEHAKSGSDAGFLNHIGIETFCLGYGGENIHTVHERISKENLIKLEEIVQNVMIRFGGSET